MFLKIFLTLVCVWSFAMDGYAQVKVIDNKGSFKFIDSSKWTLSGINIFNKNTGNVGIGTNNPLTKFHTNGTIRFQGLGTNTSDNNILTTDGSGNVTTRGLSNLLSGSAITSLNGLTGSVQTFSIGSTGTDFNIVSAASNHTFNLPSSSAANRGLLTSGDWTIFNNKENNITAGTTSQYWRGDKTWQTLNTSVVPEGTSLYFTNARARTSISLTTTGSSGVATYNNSTGVFNIPNYNTIDSTTASNGINLVSKDIRLGGNLTQNTTITNNSQSLTFATGGSALNITGLPSGTTNDSIVTVNNGLIRKIANTFIPALLEIYDAVGTQTLNTSFSDLTFGTNNIADAGYTVGGSGSQVTIVNAGTYRITYRATVNVTNNKSSGGEFKMLRNGTTVPGTLGYTYQHNSDRLQGTVTVVKLLTIAASDVIKIQGRRYSSAGNLTLTAEGSSLIIERLK
ncbi:MAG: hypothetical protein IPO98_11325 [Saprospiraceae bacterium]|nr:hypothetical protein [Saprospiraceae bacterium]